MAYNTRYLFKFDSQNGVAYEIHIMEDGYTGEVVQRALGASPIYRRDNNEHIGGTSLEILAECINDGEFTVIYTSDPYRFKVVLYQNGTAIWSGFAKPEMYSEPDIAPPYDVSITAIDGLGELKRNNYEAQGDAAIGDILSFVLSKTGLDLPLNYISSISAVTPTAIGADDILSVVVNLDHMVGESCYYVLQAILSTLNADITQLNNSWLIVRQSDIAIENDSVSAYSLGGGSVTLPISYFGSMDSYQWWPIGQMQTEIIPAKRKVVVTAENAFKENIMPGSWNIGEGATEDESEGAYSLTRLDASIDQTVGFGGEIEYRLLLSIAARNNGSGEEIGKLGLQITTEGTSSGGSRTYYLAQSASAGTARRKMNSYLWSASESSIEVELQAPAASDTASDAETIDIVIPFYRSGPRSFMRGSSLSVRIYNADGLYSQYVYDVVLSRYEQALGYQDTLNVDNGAREDASEASVLFGVINDSLENTFQYYIPMDSFGATVETWMSADVAETDYLSLIARDYAKGVALPRVSKVGKLNVGGTVGIPSLFVDSDGAAYWPLTFSWNLLNDEFDVNLRSLPLANISIESEEVTPIQGGSTSSSRATGGGGGASYLNDLLDVNTDSVTTQSVLYYNGTSWVDMSFPALVNPLLNPYLKSVDAEATYATKNALSGVEAAVSDNAGNIKKNFDAIEALTTRVKAEEDITATYKSWWDDLKSLIVKDGTNNIKINGNLIVAGDTSSEGTGTNPEVAGTLIGIKVNGQTYDDPVNGILTIPDYPTSLEWSAINGKPTKLSEFLNDSGFITSAALNGYAKTADLPTSLPASDVYAWAKKSSLALADVPDLSSKYLSTAGGTISGSAFQPFNVESSYESNAVRYVRIGLWSKGTIVGFVGWSTNEGTHLYENTTGNYLGILADGTAWCGKSSAKNTIYHTGNFNPKDYLPLSGGTINGTTTDPIIVNTSATSVGVRLQINKVNKAYVGYGSSVGAYLYNYDTGAYIGVDTSGSPLYHNGTIKNALIHSGNIGSQNVASAQQLAHSNGAVGAVVNSSGNVGMGTTSPAYKLDVNGTARISGAVTMSSTLSVATSVTSGRFLTNGDYGFWRGSDLTGALTANDVVMRGSNVCMAGATRPFSDKTYTLGTSSYQWSAVYAVNAIFSGDTATGSDIRFKDRIADHRIALSDIAEAPLFTFKWNDREDKTEHLGTSAQYWEGVAPWLVKGTDFKALDYSTLGVAIGISLANKTLNHEERIKILENKIEALEAENRRLRYGS